MQVLLALEWVWGGITLQSAVKNKKCFMPYWKEDTENEYKKWEWKWILI